MEDMDRARQEGWTLEGQLEKGAEGTPHYQLAVRTPVQVRFSAVKKMFSRAHIEIARKPKALVQYVTKEETRVAPLQSQSELYPTLKKFWCLLTKEIDDWNMYIYFHWEGPDSGFEWSDSKAGHRCPSPDEAYHKAVEQLIDKGYHVESIACNPLTISQWRKFHCALMRRAKGEMMDERRALEEAQRASVPVINADEEELDSPPSPPRTDSPPRPDPSQG